MSWKKLSICMIFCVFCTACSAQTSSNQAALDLRTALLEAGGCGFTAVIGADFGDRTYSFSVDCVYTTDGAAELTVLQPEEIAGITAVVSAEGGRLEFDGAELELGTLAGGNVSALEACRLLGQCWTGAYISACGPDGDPERVTYLEGYEDGELTVDAWLDGEHTPVYAEVAYDGVRCLTLQLTDFQLEA